MLKFLKAYESLSHFMIHNQARKENIDKITRTKSKFTMNRKE